MPVRRSQSRLAPPEEQKKVKTAIGAARAEQSREDFIEG
jgi:hypothetical protein